MYDEIVVWAVAPVGIHVDTESGEVTRVVVIDEELRYPKSIDTPVMDGDLAVSTNDYHPVGDARKQARDALEIARGEAKEPWPAWEFGY